MKGFIKWAFGLDRFILSHQEYKRVLLTSQLDVIFIIALVCYAILDLVSGYFFPIIYNVVGILVGILVLILNRKGYFYLARIILAASANLVAIFFCFVLIRDLGIYLFSMVINIGVFVAFGYEKIKVSWTIVLISTIGFLIAIFHPFKRISGDFVTQAYIDENLFFSYIIASVSSVVIIYYLLKVNYKVEASLYLKENMIAQKNIELQKVNNELDKFFYSASHDMRAPLTSMLGLINLMDLTTNANELSNYTKMLKSRILNLDNFIRSISEYSSNSSQQLNFQTLRVRELLKENLENFKFYPKADLVKILLEADEEMEIISDPVRLQIILGNLISNAIKYSDFRKAESFIKLNARLLENKLMIQIKDNGIGIKPESVNKIFGMFFRAHDHAEGAGLGLYIVKETICKLNGTISVESTFGEGTTFTIILPSLRN